MTVEIPGYSLLIHSSEIGNNSLRYIGVHVLENRVFVQNWSRNVDSIKHLKV